MSNNPLVQGALMAGKRDGVGFLSATNTDTFRQLDVKDKLDFINQYADSGQREAIGNRYLDYVRHIAPEAALGAAVGGGISYAMTPSLFQALSPEQMAQLGTTVDRIPVNSKAMFETLAHASKGSGFAGIKKYGPNLIRAAAGAAKKGLIGGAVLGGGLAAKHVFDRRHAIDTINNRLDEIKNETNEQNKNTLASSVLFSHQGYNSKRTAERPSGYQAVMKATKSVIDPLSVN